MCWLCNKANSCGCCQRLRQTPTASKRASNRHLPSSVALTEAASGALPISSFANQLSNRLQVLVASLRLGRLIGELAIEKCEALRLPAHFSPSSSRGVLLFERSKPLAVQMLQNEKRHLRKLRST